MGKPGRPKGTISETTKIALELRKKLAKEVKKKFPELYGTMLKLALGQVLRSVEYDENGNVKKENYVEPSDSMLKYLFDQIGGKALEKIEIDDKNSKEVNEMTTQLKEIIEHARLANKQITGK